MYIKKKPETAAAAQAVRPVQRWPQLLPNLLLIVLLALWLAACATTPMSTMLLDETRNDYQAAQNDAAVATYAATELREAGTALEKANAAAGRRDSSEQVDKLAYVARQKIATAQEVARQKQAEASVAQAGRQRDELRLQQRTAEADQARNEAQRAKAQADAAASSAREIEARNAALQQQLADLQARQTERGIIITLSDVLFQVDKAELSADGMRTAQKLADVLMQAPQSVVLIEGFTDSTGTADHNLQLSQRRAEAVRNALIGLGVAQEKIATRGYGEAYPVASNADAASRQLNRRVEIVLSQNGAPIASRR
ncbi:OmpA family protein [Pseudoduganella sp. FT93W]|uniref:OmpA family protein n=1 Tax=Duganella fentianensis TaxID=2692177 RepID=A0A845HSU1_9BURK|nr:OmpA family protein [Duganella fentianensis]MYN44514.1 OmpA family protein [Duganella fentianensis]